MKVVKQILVTVYDDGTVKTKDVAERLRDEVTGRFVKAQVKTEYDTPVFKEFEECIKG